MGTGQWRGQHSWALCWAGLGQAGPCRPGLLRHDRAGTLSGLQGLGGQARAPDGAAATCLQQPDSLFSSAQVDVSFLLSLELLSYQKLPADQMLPGVDILQGASGEKEMVFTQNLLLEYANQTSQVSPRPAPCTEEDGAGLDSVLVGSEEDKPRQSPQK